MVPGGRQLIQSYGDGRFRISGETFDGSVIVFPDQVVEWPVAAVANLSAADLQLVLDHQPAVEILILGCGEKLAPTPAAVKHALVDTGIVLEPMDTGAACRTYNVLLGEGRRIAAALIAHD